jgi:hypothetical protein
MQMLGVRGMAIGAALTFGAVLWWATRGTEPAADGPARLREAPASHASAFSANAWTAPADRDDPAVAPFPDDAIVDTHPKAEGQPTSDASFVDYVEYKYRFLLAAEGRSPRGSEGVRAALLERERVLVAINTARQSGDEAEKAALVEHERQLAALDQRITQSLPAGDGTAFELLKNSHIEQFQLDAYAGGVSNIAPLADSQRRAILFSKLAYRQRFREVLDHSGLMRGDLPATQRQAALDQVTRALRESRDSFLQEARQHLTDEEQYSLLANYENGEYSAELEKLNKIAAGG